MPYFLLKRIGADTVLVISACIFPWWATLLLGFILSFRFPKYYEFPALMLFLDVLFSAQTGIVGTRYLLAICACMLVIFSSALKKRMRMYS
jgi:hypothetical protein